MILILALLITLTSCGKVDPEEQSLIDETLIEDEKYWDSITITDEEASQVINEALALTPTEFKAVLCCTGTDYEALKQGDTSLISSFMNFNIKQMDFYDNFAYYIAEFGQDNYKTETALFLKTINEFTEDETKNFNIDGSNEAGYYFVSTSFITSTHEGYLSGFDVIIDSTNNEAYTNFFNDVVFYALFASFNVPQNVVAADFKDDVYNTGDYFYLDGACFVEYESQSSGYIINFTPCNIDTMVNSGVSIDEILENANYKIVCTGATPTCGAYFAEADAAAVKDGSKDTDNIVGVFIQRNSEKHKVEDILVQIPTGEGNVILSGQFGIDEYTGDYIVGELYNDEEKIFESGLRFTFENDTIRFINIDEVYAGSFELPAEMYSDFILTIAL